MKRLILCCDGTWNSADQAKDEELCPTNVIKLAVRLAKRDGDVPQILFYDQGVGTGNKIDQLTGGAFGHGLEDNIHDAYRFLLANYEPGDQIYLFGFSRGAFTARSIGGMIRKCGILERVKIRLYPAASKLYHRDDVDPNHPEAVEFRRKNSMGGEKSPAIELIGVFDTVGSLGIPVRGLRGLTRRKYQFHDVELSGTVKRAAQALAIDERRAPFEPTLWEYKPKQGQTIEQVWFTGVHTDVGGGYPETGLSDITLDWMIGKARDAGLAFDQAVMDGYPLHPDPLGTLHNSKKGLYSVTPGIDRPIGVAAKDPEAPKGAPDAADPTQSVHPRVLERWDREPGYRPKQLREYFRSTGDPRGTAR
jgi:uncharacterized protein (DUF2235 family)